MPAFRGRQLLEWAYAKGVADPELMTNLSKRDREVVAAEMTFVSGDTVADRKASDGTRKLLIEWRDGGRGAGQHAGEGARERNRHALPVVGGQNSEGDTSRQTECVMIPAGEERQDNTGPEAGAARVRRTACISSQVGCPVGCRFCASGIGGLDGNLSAGRIVEQVWRLGQLGGTPLGTSPLRGEIASRSDATTQRITNVVFMGMGEPLSNFANVMRAVRTIAAPWGLGISARKITISTVGLPKAIDRLADELDLPVTLALSLHAPNDEVRRQLIPWAEYTTINELLAACSRWFEKTGREITLEYILLRGVNDRPRDARELAELARTLRANVNLIRYNEVKGIEFGRPDDEDVLEFQRILRGARVNTHIRASRGRDIAAACGQLRHEKKSCV